jgi:hypothetical protein
MTLGAVMTGTVLVMLPVVPAGCTLIVAGETRTVERFAANI